MRNSNLLALHIKNSTPKRRKTTFWGKVKKARFKQFNKRQDKSIAEDICSMIYFLKYERINWTKLKNLIFGGNNGKTQ